LKVDFLILAVGKENDVGDVMASRQEAHRKGWARVGGTGAAHATQADTGNQLSRLGPDKWQAAH